MKLFLFLLSFLFPNSILGSSELSISTSSGIANGEYKNKVIIFEDIPYAKPQSMILDGKHQEKQVL